MKRVIIHFKALLLLALLLFGATGMAQDNAAHSVLSEHTWHRMAVTQEGIYKLDYATLAAMSIDMEHLNPNQIRIFGNPSGALPEKNSASRPDDLTEMAICVSGAEDGSFDEGDYVLFYGQEPTCWNYQSETGKVYARDRNYFTDSTFYYLCVDSGEDGLRIGTKASLPVEGTTTVITEFPDFAWHEEELFSPYYIGRNWFGEMLTAQNPELTLDFHLPNLVKSKPIYVKMQLMGRSRNASMYYHFWANDHWLANNIMISALSDNAASYNYGVSSTLDRQMLSESDSIHVVLQMVPNANGAILFLDYLELFYWRQLKRSSGLFPFRLSPGQFGAGTSAIWIQEFGSNCVLWDVTSPMQPVVQEGILSAGNFVYATDERTEKRYVAFEANAVLPIVSWTAIPNQDVHATASVDMVILTTSQFWDQAVELARFHEQEDGLTSAVVDVAQIYQEFSTGIPDPTGIRDFIRMVYLRGNGQLKYVTLFGKASFDARSLAMPMGNYVPTFETKNYSESMVKCLASDDYFGIMDDLEGQDCGGRMDLAVGRIPVSTVQEAEAVLRKIKHYNDIGSVFGEWKINHLLMADDDTEQYMNYPEKHEKMLDTLKPAINIMKVYTDAYPKVNTNSGVEIPMAHDELMRSFEKGVLVMSYCGHGGVRGLTSERVLSVSDFPTMQNFDKLPFVFTATCEFAKYDDPLMSSAGEQMLLAPNGGAIALLTSSRPTNSLTNDILARALMENLYKLDNGQPLRFGDIVKRTKNAESNFPNQGAGAVSKNLMYLLLGDPALRFPVPQGDIATLKINGVQAQGQEITLYAMSMVNVEGEVRTSEGHIDTGFNGQLWLRLFDKQSKIIPLTATTKQFSQFKDVVFQGYVSVKQGKFTASFQIPSGIKPDMGTCRLSYYAYDSIRRVDAMGSFENITIGGTDPSAMPDNEGPQISFYWNSPSFQNGDVAERQGTLFADLYDAQGIYHYDFSLGRDILLNSNAAEYNNLVLNERYEPALDDFRRGRIVIPVSDLQPGTYEFDLKVWDLQNNSSTAHLWLIVEDDVYLAGVRNYPNPFNGETYITMTHLGSEGNFNVTVEVFDLMGRNVTTLTKDMVSASDGQLEPLHWDGRDKFGTELPTGIYLYRLTLTDQQGYSRSVSQRMVIAR